MKGRIFLFSLLLGGTCLVLGDQERLATLAVGEDTYTNVIVTSISATEIFFTHSRGLGNAKLKNLDPELRKKFGFDPVRSLEVEKRQAEGNARFLAEIQKQPLRSYVAPIPPDPTVSVELAEPTIEYKFWNPAGQKPPEITGETLACTRAAFDCQSDLDLRPTFGTNGGPFRLRVIAVRLSVALPIIITIPIGAPPRVLEHEEAHRKIDEHFYELGRRAAEHAAQQILGREFDSKETDLDSARAEVLGRAPILVKLEYWKYTRVPATLANRHFDELTDHGRNNTDPAQALQKSIDFIEVSVPDNEQ